MKKILIISAVLCLLGFSGSILNSDCADQFHSASSESEYVHTSSDISEGGVNTYSHPNSPAVFGAESPQDVRSEIDPRTSVFADWTSIKRLFTTQRDYLIRSSLFQISQSVRILIFPFHSYL